MIETKRSPERAKSVSAARRAEVAARVRDDIAILRAAAAQQRHQAMADALQRILLRGSQFMFESIEALLLPQPWGSDPQGRLLGHVLTVSDEVFETLTEECLVEVLNLPEAFDREWADLEQRTAWVRTYAHALLMLARKEKRRDRALRQREALEGAVGPASAPFSRTGGGL